ncbi:MULTISPECIES: tetratricopeptide repeat protein [unclassified Streptomyces]|uniref:tetratricopeptide repeat protein n=1 Tax=unclassified Streptomyces TaxID=2593676 RepID=UPI003701DA62
MSTAHPVAEQARALLDLGRPEDAGTLLARRLAEDPTDVPAWVLLARCHRMAKNDAEALTALDEALRLAPEHYDAVHLRAHVLRGLRRRDEAVVAAREAIRINPQWWGAYALLAELLCLPPRTMDDYREGVDLAEQAIRLAPDEADAYMTMWKIAAVAGNAEAMDALEQHVLRCDPQHAFALSQQIARRAKDNDVKDRDVASAYAAALTAQPQSWALRGGLERAVYRVLRGTRLPALLCLLFAALAQDLGPATGTPATLPVPLGTRLWVLFLMGVVGAAGVWWRHRRLSPGVRMSLRSVARTWRWARIVLAQAAWTMLCALAILLPPWTDRLPPRLLIAAAVLPTLATIWFDRKKQP